MGPVTADHTSPMRPRQIGGFFLRNAPFWINHRLETGEPKMTRKMTGEDDRQEPLN